MSSHGIRIAVVAGATLAASCAAAPRTPVAETLTEARAPDGRFISWREHIIDDPQTAGVALTGGDGLVMGDLDGDGFEDIVSVHESDVEYDGVADGIVRASFASADPDVWTNVSLVDGPDAGAAEDAALADFDGDGDLDVVVACELAHIVYLENPGGAAARSEPWTRLVLPMTRGHGSYIRVFAADLDGDGRPEAIAANKGAQNVDKNAPPPPGPISIFVASGDPLDPDSWREIDLARVGAPRQAYPIDLDSDGDVDVIGGSSIDARMMVFENLGGDFRFQEHALVIDGAHSEGFHIDTADLDDDGRLDIVTQSERWLIWLAQPATLDDPWEMTVIGTFAPDSMVGLKLVDIDGDGDLDVFAGGYSRLVREHDDPDATPDDNIGRMGWFENSGDPREAWTRHDVSRRVRGMYDMFVPRDFDADGDIDIAGTRGNSNAFDGIFWLEQVRTEAPVRVFTPARAVDSRQMPLPEVEPVPPLE